MRQADHHLYIHVPFCDGKCAYCGFYSTVYSAEQADRYLDSLETEMDAELDTAASPETIYFGGGTPSILSTAQLARLCRIVHDHSSLGALKEWTAEANPGTLPADKLDILRDAGVNRISIGAQSFDDAILDAIGRRHSAKAIADTVRSARAGGIDNIGLDLIAALPGVDETLWSRTLQQALDLQPQHISVYALTVEHGCRLTPPDDETQLAALQQAAQALTDAGYARYEISNYAKPGFEAKHNLSCWRGEDYLGFGPAASSRAGLQRWTNQPGITSYTIALARGQRPPRDEETVTPETDAAERLAFAFRLAEGVDLRKFAALPGSRLERWEDSLARLASDGLTEHRGDRWFLSRRGIDLADYVAGELLG